MRPSMRRSLEGYNKVLRQKMELQEKVKQQREQSDVEVDADVPSADQEQLVEYNAVLNYQMKEAMARSKTSREIQEQVVIYQQQKQQIMQDLKAKFRSFEDPERAWERKEGERAVVARDGKLVWQKEDGSEHVFTVGELLTDIAWGLSYSLDPKSVPRLVHKQYATAVAKQELQRLLDRQIGLEEGIYREDSGIAGGGSPIEQSRVKMMNPSEYKKVPMGHVAELAVQNFFAKLQIDQGVRIQVAGGDLYQDVEQKMDFVIRCPDHVRGVDVDVKNDVLGVQFTTTFSAYIQKKKKRQVSIASQRYASDQAGIMKDHVHDIVLASIEMDLMKKLWRRWNNAGRPPGGPEQYWSAAFNRKVFANVLKGAIEVDSLHQILDAVFPKSKHKTKKNKDRPRQVNAPPAQGARSVSTSSDAENGSIEELVADLDSIQIPEARPEGSVEARELPSDWTRLVVKTSKGRLEISYPPAVLDYLAKAHPDASVRAQIRESFHDVIRSKLSSVPSKDRNTYIQKRFGALVHQISGHPLSRGLRATLFEGLKIVDLSSKKKEQAPGSETKQNPFERLPEGWVMLSAPLKKGSVSLAYSPKVFTYLDGAFPDAAQRAEVRAAFEARVEANLPTYQKKSSAQNALARALTRSVEESGGSITKAKSKSLFKGLKFERR